MLNANGYSSSNTNTLGGAGNSNTQGGYGVNTNSSNTQAYVAREGINLNTHGSNNTHTINTNSAANNIQFYQNYKKCKSFIPLGYFAIQLTCLIIIIKAYYDSYLMELNFTTVAFISSTILTLIFYVQSAYTNPGYVLGNHLLDIGGNGPFNPNLEINKNELYNGSDLNQFKGPFNKKGYHNRKTSVLTKGLQISRHERNKSKSGVPNVPGQSEQTVENLETSPSGFFPSNQQSTGSYNTIIQTVTSSTTPTGMASPISFNLSTNEQFKSQAGHHKRIPSYIKSIPLTKVAKSPNSFEQHRKMVYETIAQKISTNVSNPTTATLNDEELETYHDQMQTEVYQQLNSNKNQNNLYQVDNKNDRSQFSPLPNNMSMLSLKDKFDAHDKMITINASTQEKTNLDEDTTIINQQNFTSQSSPRQLTIQTQFNQRDLQKRTLMTRNQLRSDQLCLQIIDSVIEEQESFDGQNPSQNDLEGFDINGKQKRKTHNKKDVAFQSNTSHNRLNDEQNCYTEDTENPRDKASNKQQSNININNDEDDSEEVILFVEYKYCTVCHIEQPLRCKHCQKCDHCVATYDHHCPWIGNCVGERNRRPFFLFLLLQSIQIIIALVASAQIMFQHAELTELHQILKVMLIIVVLTLIGFFYFVFSLLVFHTFLASKNLTTWEFLSWMKITYLKVWPKKYGSPFSKKSIKNNLRLFCCYNFSKSKNIYQWHMPNKLPRLK